MEIPVALTTTDFVVGGSRSVPIDFVHIVKVVLHPSSLVPFPDAPSITA